MSQVVIVTGGAGGMGSAICTGLVSDGNRVVIADFDGTAAERLTKDLGGGSLAVRVDVSNKKSVENMVSEARSRFGNIDVLLNGGRNYATSPCQGYIRGGVGPSDRD